jgi:putative endonuclease
VTARQTNPDQGPQRAARHRAWRHGRMAETMAAVFLRLTGWRVLARNWRCAAGEIDIIARRRRILAFIEVKTRAELTVAGEAIGVRQRERIRRAASLYLARHPTLVDLDARFDAMLILPWRWPVHLHDAWRD